MKRNADIMENEAKRGMRNKKNLGGEMHGQKSNQNFRVLTWNVVGKHDVFPDTFRVISRKIYFLFSSVQHHVKNSHSCKTQKHFGTQANNWALVMLLLAPAPMGEG